MSRTPSNPEGGPDELGSSPPRTTIVGGRPPEQPTAMAPVPTGIQQLLRLASIDPAFCRELCAKRAAVALACGVELTANEHRVLAAIGSEQLELMARMMPPPAAPRREFLRTAAASAVVLLGGAALGEAISGCDRPEDRNYAIAGATVELPRATASESADAASETPPARSTRRETEADGGISPELPPARSNERPLEGQGGHAPDLPPARPTQNHPTRGIEPDLP